MLLLVACAPAPEPIVVTFSVNVHDWVFVDESASTVERLLDLHEEAGVPVDVFLTDPMARAYEQGAPYLLDRLRASRIAAVSYHIRPPAPYYPEFDWLGIDALDAGARYALFADYEAHAIDLATGRTTPEVGGYAHLSALLGTPPLAVGPGASETLAQVLADQGVVFEVVHGEAHDLGDTVDSLWIRPEHIEVKLYESEGDPCAVFDAAVEAGPTATSGPRFMNVKWHENDLYTKGIPWRTVYWDDDDAALPPPWNLDAWDRDVGPTSAILQAERLDFYAASLRCVTDHPETYTPTNLAEVATWL